MTWRVKEESIDDQTKKAMKDIYEWIFCYIRALAIINERLYVERGLKELTHLHSKLVTNRNISYGIVNK